MKFIFEKENFIDLDICKKLIKYQKDNCPKNEPKGLWANRIVTDYDIKIKKLIEPIHNKILRLIKKFYKEKNITRQIGCMGAIDFDSSKKSLSFLKNMLNEGYILEYGSENINTIVYCLPYIMSSEDYSKFLKTINEFI